MEPQPPSPALSIKVMPPEPLPKGSSRCLDPHSRAMVSGARAPGLAGSSRDPPGRECGAALGRGAGSWGDPPGSAGPGAVGTRQSGDCGVRPGLSGVCACRAGDAEGCGDPAGRCASVLRGTRGPADGSARSRSPTGSLCLEPWRRRTPAQRPAPLPRRPSAPRHPPPRPRRRPAKTCAPAAGWRSSTGTC